ncbi:MAG: ATP-grasp domain-containing protein, partial [Solimonas sp.]
MKIGILGAGQLGRMLALAGYPLDFDFVFLDPATEACAAPLGTHLHADYVDERALAEFCAAVDVATYEFENVPAKTAEFVAARLPLLPAPVALSVGQDRLSEKSLFDRLGIPVPRYMPVATREALGFAVKNIGLPAVLKTRRLGYDGKGQAVLKKPEDLDAAWARLGGQPLILEAFVPFERELSCLAVRGKDGGMRFYPVVENVHRDGILRTATPRADDPLQKDA